MASVFLVGEQHQQLMSQMVNVTLDFTIDTILVLHPNIKRVHFIFNNVPPSSSVTAPRVNAFHLLMASARDFTVLPQRLNEPRDGLAQIHNWLINLLEAHPTA